MCITGRVMSEARHLLDAILELHDEVRDEVVSATERQHLETLSSVDRDRDGDTIYAIDVVGEEVVSRFAETLAATHSFVLVAEGLPAGRRRGARDHSSPTNDGRPEFIRRRARTSAWQRVMYQKRSA